MIVVDTSVLYAATDRSDTHHVRCRDWIIASTESLLIPSTVLAETCYLSTAASAPTQRPPSSMTWGLNHRVRTSLST